MADAVWSKLNVDFHTFNENPKNRSFRRQPPYLEQALLIQFLVKNQLIDGSEILDYAGGHGTLAMTLWKYFGIKASVFDPYMANEENKLVKYVDRTELKAVKTLINSAVFEHVRSRQDLDDINNLVSDIGVMILHTVVCENIPKDPDWFYLAPPVHSALHTNKSMGILMEQWGYRSSLYCPVAKCWILLKQDLNNPTETVGRLNEEIQLDYLYHKDGFVDYWKGF